MRRPRRTHHNCQLTILASRLSARTPVRFPKLVRQLRTRKPGAAIASGAFVMTPALVILMTRPLTSESCRLTGLRAPQQRRAQDSRRRTGQGGFADGGRFALHASRRCRQKSAATSRLDPTRSRPARVRRGDLPPGQGAFRFNRTARQSLSSPS